MRNILAAITLTIVLMVGTTFAGDGLLVSDLTSNPTPQPCSQTTTIVNELTGIIVIGFTGIIVIGVADAPTDCGIIVIG